MQNPKGVSLEKHHSKCTWSKTVCNITTNSAKGKSFMKSSFIKVPPWHQVTLTTYTRSFLHRANADKQSEAVRLLPFLLVSFSVYFDFIFCIHGDIDNMNNVRAEVIHFYDIFSGMACEIWAALCQLLWLTFASTYEWVKQNPTAANIQFLRFSGYSSHIHHTQKVIPQMTFAVKLQYYF